MLATVERPAEPETGLGNDTAEVRIGEHIAPGGRRRRTGFEMQQVLSTTWIEPAKPVVE